MRFRTKPTAAIILAFLVGAWELVGQPLWNLNVERLAEDRAIDGTLRDTLPALWGFQVPSSIADWSTYLTGPFLTGFVAGALVFGLWDIVARNVSRWTPRLRRSTFSGSPTTSSVTSAAPGASHSQDDYDLRALDPPLHVYAIRSDDGTDISPKLVIRNHSRTPIWYDFIDAPKLTVAGRPSEKTGGGASNPFRSGATQTPSMGTIRMYEPIVGCTGECAATVLFGKSQNTARTLARFHYQFRILLEPKNKDRRELVDVEILKDSTTYEFTESEAQKRQRQSGSEAGTPR